MMLVLLFKVIITDMILVLQGSMLWGMRLVMRRVEITQEMMPKKNMVVITKIMQLKGKKMMIQALMEM